MDHEQKARHGIINDQWTDDGDYYFIRCKCGWAARVQKSYPTEDYPHRADNAWAAATMASHLALESHWPWAGKVPKNYKPNPLIKDY